VGHGSWWLTSPTIVPSRWSAATTCNSTQLGWRWRCRWRVPIIWEADLLVAFTCAGQTFAASVVACARWWIWRRQCLRQPPFQVVDDDILKVVDVLLIGVNSWWIHPLWETTLLWLGGVLQICKKTLSNQRKMMNQCHGHCLPMRMGSARSDNRSYSIPHRLASCKLTVWTPRPHHWLLGFVASNFTHGSGVTLTFQ
jgi:hypothetical protein